MFEGTCFKLKEADLGALRQANRPQSQTEKKIYHLIFDLPGEKVNKFTHEVMAEFDRLLSVLEDPAQAGKIDVIIVISPKPGIFIAGADIEMIRAVHTPEEGYQLSNNGQKLLNRWEDLPFPTVVAIEGAALGGGCEYSLASTAIVMSSDPAARIGLPEVMLGVIPGTGGCVRLPRRIGLPNSLDLILTGRALSGEKAYRLGLADAVLPKEGFGESVLKWVLTNHSRLLSGAQLGKSPKWATLMGSPVARALILSQATKSVQAKTKGHYPAPFEAIAVLKQNAAKQGVKLRGKAREQALEREAQAFGRLAATEISKNLIRIFYLTEKIKKDNGLKDTTVSGVTVASPAVLGAGVMGGGIAELFAEKNLPVRMKDIRLNALELGVQAANKIFQKQVKRRKISRREGLKRRGLISPSLSYTGFRSVDFVVEAVIENMELKKQVLRETEAEVGAECVLVTNTSSLSVSEMQRALSKPERFAGMHFFNPVNKMPLIEVIRGEKTSDQTVATVFEFSKKIGKFPVVVKDAPGFLVNRLLLPYLNEAAYCVSEGMRIEELDQVFLDFGMPMGPIELIDEVGVDVGEKVAHILHAAFGERSTPCPLNSKMVATKRLGKKVGAGFYLYKNNEKSVDSTLYGTLGLEMGRLGDKVLERCIFPMINEAARCLEESVVSRPEEVDLAMIMGTGFPPFRGGLLRYADQIGLKVVVEELQKCEKRFGARFAVSEGLLRRVRDGKKFYE